MEITEGMSDIEKEYMKEELVRKIKDSAEKSFGNVPNFINELLDEYSEKVVEVVSWKRLLKQFIGVNISSDLEVNKKRPNKRFDWSFANKPIYKCNVFFGADSK
jgi:predicted metal-dependent peptidase